MRRLPLVLAVSLTALLPALRAQSSFQIGLSGYNADIIVGIGETQNNGANATVSTFVYYEAGLSSSSFPGTFTQGLPSGTRMFTSEADATVHYQLAPYASGVNNSNNVALLSGNASQTLTLNSPTSFETLHFLVTVQNTSGGSFDVTLNFSDSSSTTTPTFTSIADWTSAGGSGAIALSNMGLLGNTSGYAGNLYIRDFSFALSVGDQAKTLNSISVHSFGTSGGPFVFFGASGITAAIPEPSSYAAILGVLVLGAVGVRKFRRRIAT